MGNLHFGKNKLGKFIKGNGFYIALAVCLAGAGFASWAAINGTLNRLTTQQPITAESEGENDWDFPEIEQAGQNEASVPIENNVSSESPELSEELQSQQDSATMLDDTSDSLQTVVPQTPQQDLLFVQPISGDIINNFSAGELVLDKTMKDWRTHNGVDLAAKAGTPVKAVTDGTVTRVYTDGMWGTVVEISHPGNIVSRYCSLTEAVTVAEGDTVEIGEVIGCVGDTALAETGLATHLHFEVLVDGKYVDPMQAIANGSIE